MFSIIGKIDGVQQRIEYRYNDGKGTIVGDKAITYLVQWELDNRSIVGPVGQYMEADINNPLSVLFVVKGCFDAIEEIEGDIPEAESVPDGSIC